MSSCCVSAAATALRAGIMAAARGEPGKHFAMQRTAVGQAFEQSGPAGCWSGQHGMPSGREAMSGMAAIEASAIAPAPDGITIGAARRLAIARTESKRDMSDKNCTQVTCHRARGARRGSGSRSSQGSACHRGHGLYAAPHDAAASLIADSADRARLLGIEHRLELCQRRVGEGGPSRADARR